MNHWDQVILENEEREEERLECSRCDGTGEAQYEPVPGVNPEMGVSITSCCHACRGTGWAS